MKIKPIQLEYVKSHDEYWNSNNFKTKIDGSLVSKEEYIQLSKDTLISEFSQMYSDIIKINLTKSELKMLEKASLIAIQTNTIPSLYQDDLSELAKKIDSQNPPWPCFVRFNSCSPKDVGCLKVNNSLETISLLIRSRRLYNMYKDELDEQIILKKWDQHMWDNRQANEFRVFIFNQNITAISQYSCYDDYNFKRFENDFSEILNQIKRIQTHIQTFFKPKNYALDVFVEKTEKISVTFVEINAFGMESPCGSCLFHWLDDQKVLYGDGSMVEIRYVE